MSIASLSLGKLRRAQTHVLAAFIILNFSGDKAPVARYYCNRASVRKEWTQVHPLHQAEKLLNYSSDVYRE